MTVTVTRVEHRANDVLMVIGTTDQLHYPDGTARQLAAPGWFSALTNHYPAADYDGNGNLIAGSLPRPRTAAERLQYFQQLLQAAEHDALVAAQAAPALALLNPDGT